MDKIASQSVSGVIAEYEMQAASKSVDQWWLVIDPTGNWTDLMESAVGTTALA